jgi:hypothetical protein
MTDLFMTDQTEAEPALRCRVCQKRVGAHPPAARINHARMHVRKNEAFVVEGTRQNQYTDSYYVGPKPAEVTS